MQHHSHWQRNQDVVFWVKLFRAQDQGLQFFDKKSHAIVVYDLVPAECIYKSYLGTEIENCSDYLQPHDPRQKSHRKVIGNRSSSNSSKSSFRGHFGSRAISAEVMWQYQPTCFTGSLLVPCSLCLHIFALAFSLNRVLLMHLAHRFLTHPCSSLLSNFGFPDGLGSDLDGMGTRSGSTMDEKLDALLSKFVPQIVQIPCRANWMSLMDSHITKTLGDFATRLTEMDQNFNILSTRMCRLETGAASGPSGPDSARSWNVPRHSDGSTATVSRVLWL